MATHPAPRPSLGTVQRITVAAFLVLLTACGAEASAPASDAATSGAAPTVRAPSTTAATLPPHTIEQLAPILDPMVQPLGFRVTRASLISLDDYQPTPNGTHLAVYVVPIDDRTTDDYASEIVPLAAALLPDVFDRWPLLRSFDVCQEPFGWDGEGTPPSYTILDLDRGSASGIDWGALELSELVALSTLDPDITLSVHEDVGRSATFQTALDQARRTASVDSEG